MDKEKILEALKIGLQYCEEAINSNYGFIRRGKLIYMLQERRKIKNAIKEL